MIYRAHGDHQLHWQDNIVVAKLYGTWNEEAANEYGNALKQQVKSLKGRYWCRVVDFSDYELHTPEVAGAIRRFARWAEQNGCIFHCYIFSNLLQREAVKQMLKPAGQQHRNTATIDEAPTVEDAVAKCRLALARSACTSR
jgi:hypothetical protein